MAEGEFLLEAQLWYKGFGNEQDHGEAILKRIARELYLQFGGTVWLNYDGRVYDGKKQPTDQEQLDGQDVGVHEPSLDSEAVQRVDPGEEVSDVQAPQTAAGA